MTTTTTDRTVTSGATELAIAAAAAGAAWLDSHDPGWTTRIDVWTLDLTHNDECILGQLYDGDFWGALDYEIPDAARPGESHLDTATRLGFYASCPGGDESAYTDLTAAWLIEIGNRRG